MTPTTKYFFDTEFIENGETIDLISIGIVAESPGVQTENRTLYLQNIDCKFQKASDWVWRNVFPHLLHFDMRGGRNCVESPHPNGPIDWKVTWCRNQEQPCPWRRRSEIRDEIKKFCDPELYGKPEFWGYYADYDWVVFCQLFGAMVELPKGFPMYCRDLKQRLDDNGNPRFQKDSPHHALADAEWIADTFRQISTPGISVQTA